MHSHSHSLSATMKRESPTKPFRRPPTYFLAGSLAVISVFAVLISKPRKNSVDVIGVTLPSENNVYTSNSQKSNNSLVEDLNLSSEDERFFKRKSLVDYKKIFMDKVEVDFVLRHLDGKKNYFEYGSGGSTLNFVQFFDSAVSVEHDRPWCEKLSELMKDKPWRSKLDYRCSFVENGNNNEGNYVRFKHVVDQIDLANRQVYDFVLIDGRARVDSAIKVLGYITRETAVVVHDANRFTNKEYEPMLEFYETVESISSETMRGIALLRRRKIFDHLQGNHSAVQSILNIKYKL